ncbi:LysE/ArgO family amino acid transporter [Marinibaculum pumilum]|uniref:LysE/ArgO family amino acid transporter n=1 Tax=Marinibaculum pumilum TaxID=1766165 RepID=A0ABV7L5V1_9PROT
MPGWALDLAAGFSLGFGLIMAIGAQNAFVLRQGLRREHVGAVVAACALSDAALIAAGVAGFGILVERAAWIAPLFRYGAAAFLLFYGARAAWSAWRGGEALDPAAGGRQRLGPTLATCLALTWLNPHVYLDTVVLLGSVAAQAQNRLAFGIGATAASLVFFTALGFGARLLSPLFARPVTWRVLDALIALVMWAIAAALLLAEG